MGKYGHVAERRAASPLFSTESSLPYFALWQLVARTLNARGRTWFEFAGFYQNMYSIHRCSRKALLSHISTWRSSTAFSRTRTRPPLIKQQDARSSLPTNARIATLATSKEPREESAVEPVAAALLLVGGLVGQELGLLAVDDVLAREEIGGRGRDAWLPGDQLVAEYHS